MTILHALEGRPAQPTARPLTQRVDLKKRVTAPRYGVARERGGQPRPRRAAKLGAAHSSHHAASRSAGIAFDVGGGWERELIPGGTDDGSFADFADPDGSEWVLQERGYGR
jgi:hypothetical protein